MAGNSKYYTPSFLTIYLNSFNAAVIKPAFQTLADRWVNRMIANMGTYMQIQNATGVPWYFVACIHMRESGMDFTKHLHNGDPLTKRTTHVPAGRPVAAPANGKTYTFAESAIDALKLQGFDKWKDWSIPGMLHLLEVYNGTGYVAKGVSNPYLWSGTQFYSAGKYVADGRYSATAVDQQLGAGALLKAYLKGYTPDGKKKNPNRLAVNGGILGGIGFFLFGQ